MCTLSFGLISKVKKAFFAKAAPTASSPAADLPSILDNAHLKISELVALPRDWC
jgi:hypothetical protein